MQKNNITLCHSAADMGKYFFYNIEFTGYYNKFSKLYTIDMCLSLKCSKYANN